VGCQRVLLTFDLVEELVGGLDPDDGWQQFAHRLIAAVEERMFEWGCQMRLLSRSTPVPQNASQQEKRPAIASSVEKRPALGRKES
jgi:hypothetical protein